MEAWLRASPLTLIYRTLLPVSMLNSLLVCEPRLSMTYVITPACLHASSQTLTSAQQPYKDAYL
eukprot:1157469-Pelagomonas_calceolata.AAC.2